MRATGTTSTPWPPDIDPDRVKFKRTVRRRRLLVIAMCALGAFVVMVIGLRSQQPNQATSPDIGPLPVITDTATIVLPLDVYLLTDEQRFVVDQAIYVLGKKCMARFNLDLPWPPPSRPTMNYRERRYGVVDPDAAARWGYTPPSDPTTNAQAGAQPPPAEAVAVWTGTGQSAYRGVTVPDGGCSAQAQRELDQGQAPPDRQLIEQLEGVAGRQAERDRRLLDGFARWSDCMRLAGFNYQDPWAANDDPTLWPPPVAGTGEPAAPPRQQIATAVAYAGCKRETNLVGLWVTLESGYQQRQIDERHGELETVRAAIAREIQHANDIVAANP